jgi:hypothetical protein
MSHRLWHRTMIRILAVVGVAAGMTTTTVTAPSPASAVPTCLAPTQHDSQNWSGIIDYCHTYYLATGRFTAGCATGQAGSIESFFAGLGGVKHGSQLIQTVVTDLVYTADGTHNFRAYAETAGTSHQKTDISPPGGIHCGDRMLLAVVQYSQPWNTGDQLYQVYNETTGKHTAHYVYRSTEWPGTDGSTAEFIIERPTLDHPSNPSCPYAPLTKWGGWPVPTNLTTSYLAADGAHSDQSMTSVDYVRAVMHSCDGQRILEEPKIFPEYNDMWMYWRAAF